jgi:hypothetical protein
MAGAHEQLERAEHAEHAAHGGHGDGSNRSNKRIALLIAILALFLAIAETLGKGAQTEALSYNVEASNLWAFFQAKTIRQTAVRTAAETVELTRPQVTDPAVADATAKRLDAWQKTVARWESEPETGEGRKELSARAKQVEAKRDTALARYHHYEVASAAFQIAIVLASATVITGAMILAWISIGVGVVGLAFAAIGLLAPHAVHLFRPRVGLQADKLGRTAHALDPPHCRRARLRLALVPGLAVRRAAQPRARRRDARRRSRARAREFPRAPIVAHAAGAERRP